MKFPGLSAQYSNSATLHKWCSKTNHAETIVQLLIEPIFSQGSWLDAKSHERKEYCCDNQLVTMHSTVEI
mgnify:CR=1 FL=1